MQTLVIIQGRWQCVKFLNILFTESWLAWARPSFTDQRSGVHTLYRLMDGCIFVMHEINLMSKAHRDVHQPSKYLHMRTIHTLASISNGQGFKHASWKEKHIDDVSCFVLWHQILRLFHRKTCLNSISGTREMKWHYSNSLNHALPCNENTDCL